MPAPNSRFHDPTCVDDPQLPNPAPQLYGYCLPPLPEHDPKRFRQSLIARQQKTNSLPNQLTKPSSNLPSFEPAVESQEKPTLRQEPVPATDAPNAPLQFDDVEPLNIEQLEAPAVPAVPIPNLEVRAIHTTVPHTTAPHTPQLASTSHAFANTRAGRPQLERLPPAALPAPVQLTNYQELISQLLPTAITEKPSNAEGDSDPKLKDNNEPNANDLLRRNESSQAELDATAENDDAEGGLRVVPIPDETWESLPNSCRSRMLEFQSIRDEFRRTFDQSPTPAERDNSPRLALEDIVAQALINNRGFQSDKETLYQAALCLCLERFAYDIKFSPRGNGSALNFSHNRFDITNPITGDRVAGASSSTLGIPTGAQLERMLLSGGEFMLGFANNVILNFNGPAGFTTSASSEIVGRFSQALLQNDINFENLTQAERDVVYAARRFARSRKNLFRDLANQYYNLLLTYRGIEIDSQDYFSNLRGLLQAQAEYRAGRLPRFQVDQFEQNALSSRSNLISSCNNLESSFDSLKLSTGLPPELPINLDLRELEELTLRDEATVAGELIQRALRNLTLERQQTKRDENVLLNGAIDLAGRTLTLLELRESLGQRADAAQDLRMLWAELQVNETSMLVDLNRQVLEKDIKARPPAPPLRLFQRTMEVIDSQLTVVDRQLKWHAISEQADDTQPATPAEPNSATNIIEQSIENLQSEYDAIANDLVDAVEKRELERIPSLVRDAADLLEDADKLSNKATQLTESLSGDDFDSDDAVLRRIDKAINVCQQIAYSNVAGLAPLELDMDDAMLTAVVQRFELMNERGALADQWRQIKLAGDDLRSVLNLNAGFNIGTDSTDNNPFDFTFDESSATLGLAFDAPLNRRSQAKTYRLSLLNYNAAIRNLIDLEDTIKVNVRDDLRDLQLDREQYDIAVASAALAKERVVSTRLQLRLGIENVAARDVLESQQAYTASLNSVAREHIRYILDRIDLFLDLELLEVDDTGFWPELYNDDYTPLSNWQYPVNAGFAYGSLPACVWYSDCMRRMDCIPFGQAQIGQCPTYSIPSESESDDADFAFAEPLIDSEYADGNSAVNTPTSDSE